MSVGSRHRPLREEVLVELRRLILEGELEAGTHLTEAAIAERLAVSRLPVREAFRKLEAEGLLEALPRRGVRVVRPDADELQTVHEIRIALELIAVRRATERADAAVFTELRDALAAGDTAVREGRDDQLDELNERFHDILARGSGSRVLIETLRSVRNQVHHLVGGKKSAADLSWDEHASIVRAVLDSDGEMASLLMRRHLLARHQAHTPADPA
ncbi:GntR family transcriptional regulator [Catenuloplanes japonicus]|uniref:GntR family transcriptional regulator n=1 Tax=Catenuloplanes japonicus TaxID=33876 RepID=UPI00068B0245|nr:GntR family transcriptional regulator [Catenuloplanes japonicus]